MKIDLKFWTIISTGVITCTFLFYPSSDKKRITLHKSYSIQKQIESGLQDIEKNDANSMMNLSEKFFVKDSYGVDSKKNDLTPNTNSTLLIKIEKFHKYTNMNLSWWLSNYITAENLRNEIIETKNKLHYTLSDEEKRSLKQALILAMILDIDMSEALKIGFDDIEITSEYWSLINTFIQSDDFEKLLSRNKLTANYLEYDNLLAYSYAPTEIYKDGKSMSTSTQSAEDDPEYVDSNED